jgi:hypothetical protein
LEFFYKKQPMKNLLIGSLLLLFCLEFAYGQKTSFREVRNFQGYAQSIGGATINYNSPQPEVETALLARAKTEFKIIEWETEQLPVKIEEEFINFIWIFGVDVNVESRAWDLLVNGKKYLTFYNPKNNDQQIWSVDGIEGSKISFRRTMIDRHGDAFGYASFTLPKSSIQKFYGQSLKLTVLGEEAGSNVWYMTFISGITERFEINQEQMIVKEDDKLFNQVKFEAVYLGENTTGEITIENILTQKFELFTGYNNISLQLPLTEQPASYLARIVVKDKTIERNFSIEPVKEWTIYFVQHSHTDIGYTRSQTEILPEHLRFIDYALDYCDLTDDFPDNAKFRWTCESAWAVREYLEQRPVSQIERLKKRINEGRIEVTGMFFNMSEIADETTLAALTQPIRYFNENGITVQTAMQNDVNGIGWCMSDYFPDLGVKYLIMGEHGHRARIPFDLPTAFWWESPSGNRLLAFRGEHYMFGNGLGIHLNNIETFGRNLMKYLSSLDKKGYPFNQIGLQYSGYVTDNSPPAISACELVKQWNEQYVTPKLRIATASEYMKFIEENHAGDLPVYRKAWPDWWTDGAGSAARETAAVRQSQNDMIANLGLFSMANMLGENHKNRTQEDINTAMDAIAFYDEHTYGAAESIYDPFNENSMVQWGEKGSYAWEAVKRSALLREEGVGLIQNYLPRSSVPTITVFNTLNWSRSGLVVVYIDHEMLDGSRQFQLLDEADRVAEAQLVGSREDGSYWGIWVEYVPPAGYKTYRITQTGETSTMPGKWNFKGLFENEFYKFEINQQRGTVQSLLDKELGIELVDQKCPWQFGEFIYEQLDNRSQMERFTSSRMDTVYKELIGSKTTMKNIRVESGTDGPVWKSLFIHGEMPVCADKRGITCEIRLFNKEKRIEFTYSLFKLPVTSPEAIYVAFPFSLPESHLLFEAQGGMVVPGRDQLEGTSSDWNTIQSFASVRGTGSQILFSSVEMPLVQFGGINTGKYNYISNPKQPWIFSYPMNNYWTTNFRALQEGEHKWNYSITSIANPSNVSATRFGWDNQIPMLTRVQPAGNSDVPMESISFFDLETPGLLLVSCRPAFDGSGIVLHLREVNGSTITIPAKSMMKRNPARLITEVSATETKINDAGKEIILNPYEIKFIKIQF